MERYGRRGGNAKAAPVVHVVNSLDSVELAMMKVAMDALRAENARLREVIRRQADYCIQLELKFG